MAASSSVKIGQYEIINRLAIGGMGEIFLARQVGIAGFERLVIIKTLLPSLAQQENTLAQFLDEARVAATLNHPNVVSILEVGKQDGTYFIAMEYIQGIDFNHFIRLMRKQKSVMPHRVGAALLRKVALGLDHAHNAVDVRGQLMNMVHRDVSPQNIMVRLDGGVKVVDFGIAHVADRVSRTQDNYVKGKLRYMSPEQIQGLPLDSRSDQFSLGIVMWELYARRALFRSKNVVEATKLIVQSTIIPLSQMLPDCPPQVDAIAQRMLARDPAQRFASCAEVANAMQAYLDESGGNADAEVGQYVYEVAGLAIQEHIAKVEQAGTDALSLSSLTPTLDAAAPEQSSELILPCPHCGFVPTSKSKFCDSCGMSRDSAGHGYVATFQKGMDVEGGEHLLGETKGGASMFVSGGQFFEEPSDIQEFELVTSETRLHSAVEKFRGRERELAELSKLATATKRGVFQGRLILGETGIGKTRLFDEAEAALNERGFNVARARAGRFGVPVALDILRQWVLALSNNISGKPLTLDRLHNKDIKTAISWLSKLNLPEAMEERLQLLFSGSPAGVIHNAVEHKQRAETALLGFFWTLSRIHPLALLVDDLHRSDLASLEFLQELPYRMAGCQVLMLASTTPANDEALLRNIPRMQLEGFEDSDLTAIVSENLGLGRLLPEVERAICADAKGNPMVAACQARAMLDIAPRSAVGPVWQGELVIKTTSYAKTPQQCAQWRVANLTPEAVRVLQVAAVIGEEFTTEVLDLVLAGENIEMDVAMYDAVDLGLICSLAGSRRLYCFQQGNYRQLILQSIDNPSLQRIRRLLAGTYNNNELQPHGLTLELMANLHIANGAVEDGARCAAAAAFKLLDQGVIKVALEMFNRAMNLGLRQVTHQGGVAETISATLYKLAASATLCSRHTDATTASAIVLPLIKKLPPQHAPLERALALRQRGRALMQIHRSQEALGAYDQAIQALGEADGVVKAMILADRAFIFERLENKKEAIVQLTSALQVLGNSGLASRIGMDERFDHLVRGYCRLSRLYFQMNRVDLAQQAAQRALQIGQRTKRVMAQVQALRALASLALAGGNQSGSNEFLLDAQRLAERSQDPWLLAQLSLERAELLRESSPDTAAGLFQRAYSWATLSGQTKIKNAAHQHL